MSACKSSLNFETARELSNPERELLHECGLFALLRSFNSPVIFKVPACCTYSKSSVNACKRLFEKPLKDLGALVVTKSLPTKKRSRVFASVEVQEEATIDKIHRFAEEMELDPDQISLIDMESHLKKQGFKAPPKHPETISELDRLITQGFGKTLIYGQDWSENTLNALKNPENPMDLITAFNAVTIVRFGEDDAQNSVLGVNHPYMLLGQLGNTAQWHCEDSFVDAVLWLLQGSESENGGKKYWVLIDRTQREKLLLALKKYLDKGVNCPQFMQRKIYSTSVQFLLDKGITPRIFAQDGGDVVYIPGDTSHFVINSGRNLGLSTNCIGGSFWSGSNLPYIPCSCNQTCGVQFDELRKENLEKIKEDTLRYLESHSRMNPFHKNGHFNPQFRASTTAERSQSPSQVRQIIKEMVNKQRRFRDSRVVSSNYSRKPPVFENTGKRVVPSSRSYSCPTCAKRFKQYTNMRRHVRQIHGKSQTIVCLICSIEFVRPDDLDRHLRNGKCRLDSQ